MPRYCTVVFNTFSTILFSISITNRSEAEAECLQYKIFWNVCLHIVDRPMPVDAALFVHLNFRLKLIKCDSISISVIVCVVLLNVLIIC